MKTALTIVLAIFSSLAAAEDTIYLEETVITGNQELPKVLYILPWQEMETTLLPKREFEFGSQSVLVPIYPHEQKRAVALREYLKETRARETDSNAPE